jgi:DNA-3-methyladenine glycosylase II
MPRTLTILSLKAHNYLLDQADTISDRVTSLIEKNGEMSLRRNDNLVLFDFLSRSVVGQQLSKTAAESIWGRLIALSLRRKSGLLQFSILENFEHMKGCGLSAAKVKTIIGLSEAIRSGLLIEEDIASLDSDSLKREITKLWGIGPWTADMTAIFYFNFPNIWSPTDASLTKGMRILSNGNLELEETILRTMSPYLSYFALHVWEGLDSGRLY